MGYFQVINQADKTSLKLIGTSGEDLDINEIMHYLDRHSIPYDAVHIKNAMDSLAGEAKVDLCNQKSFPIREELHITLSSDKMLATGRFYPPSNNGALMERIDILRDIEHQGLKFGVREDNIKAYTKNREYCKDIVLAEGKPPRHGTDASITYYFNTDLKAKPTLLEDGSVDFFNLNIINHCKAGDCLAKLTPEDVGEEGQDVQGTVIRPRSVKREILKFSRNAELSEDRLRVFAKVDGHVALVEGKIYVSDVMVVENVDSSTGNIRYDGNVQVNGNVCTNYRIHAKGNVEIRGVVEGAEIIASGNITIARGMNGMGRGTLQSGGNVIAKFIENATVESRGYVEAGSIMHSKVMAGTEIRVGGKKGFIAGGYVCATNLVDVKTLGAELGANTVVEIGINPDTKIRYHKLQEQIRDDQMVLDKGKPILETAKVRIKKGEKLPVEQVKQIQDLSSTITRKQKDIEMATKEMEELQQLLAISSTAQVIVRDKVYPGTKIIISDVSKIIKSELHYCRFIKSQGDVVSSGI